MLSAREFNYKLIERDNINEVVSDNTQMIIRISKNCKKMFSQQHRQIKFLTGEMVVVGTIIYILGKSVKKLKTRVDELEINTHGGK